MNPVIGQCPICQDELHVTRLQCGNCATTIEGHFALSSFQRLSAEQLRFVEMFIRNEGKLNRVEQEMGLSYPAVRARLSEVIESMGYEVDDSPPVSEETRREVLSDLNSGTLTAEEALQILRGEG